MRKTLNFISTFVVALCIVAAIVFIILYATGTAHNVLDPLGDALERGNVGELVGLSTPQAGLPPTWTPRVTFVPTLSAPETPESTSAQPTSPPVPTQTPIVKPTNTPEANDVATVTGTQSATGLPTATLLPTDTRSPADRSLPTATPQPLYMLSELLGGPDCEYVGFSGTVSNLDGSGREGVKVELFNDFDDRQSVITNEKGLYEVVIDNSPQSHLEGNWHIRVLEDNIQVSNEIIVVMSSSCEESDDLTRFVANFTRTK